MEIGNELMHSVFSHEVIGFDILGYRVSISNSTVILWLVIIVMILLARWLTKGLTYVPQTKKQNMAEIIVGGINNFTKDILGSHWKEYAPFLGTIFLFLVISNAISIFNILPTSEQLYHLTGIEFFEKIPVLAIQPPTKDLSVTLSLAVLAILMTVLASIRAKKVKGWLKSHFEPTPIIAPIKFLEYFIRAISLAFRLFGNILGAFIVMEIIYIMMPLVLPTIFSMYFDLFDGILQAFIFVFLTTIYITEAVE